MLISLNWLHDYITLPKDLSSEQLSHDLTMVTVEVEKVENLADPLNSIIVAQIASIDAHPENERLSLVTMNIGGGQQLNSVCGGGNLEVGLKVPLALPGAKLKDANGAYNEVKPGNVRGHESQAVLCAASELGLSDLFPSNDDRDILLLNDVPCEAGDELAKIIGYDDIILEVDNKSLTNRPDLWGHYGIARELAAIYKLPIKALPENQPPAQAADLVASINPDTECSRYTLTQFDNIAIKPSPFWLKSRLARMGQKPINLIVDLTNYVMLTTGQPVHAFDKNSVNGGLTVRFAAQDEPMTLLDDRELKLDPQTVVIADDNEPVALAGVMGGLGSSVNDDTATLWFEAATFKAEAVRRTTKRYGARTDSSTRFEKGLDPLLVDTTLSLFISLLKETLPEASAVAHLNVFPNQPNTVKVNTSVPFICRRLGKKLSAQEISDLLALLGFRTHIDNEALSITVPSWRATGDVSIAEDIVEEVARLYGYDNLEFVPPTISLEKAVVQPAPRLERRVEEYLANNGMHQIVTYPWVEDRYLEAVEMADIPCLLLAAGPSPSCRKLQPSLIPQLLANIESNTRFFNEFAVFNSAKVFKVTSGSDVAVPQHDEPRHVAGALVGSDAASLFYQAKGILENLTKTVHADPFTMTKTGKAPAWCDPAGFLSLEIGGKVIGSLGVLSARARRLSGISSVDAVIFELNLDALSAYPSRENKYIPMPTYSQVNYDISLVTKLDVSWSKVQQLSLDAHDLVLSVEFVDEYRGESIEKGMKSLTLRLCLGHVERTLKTKQIDEAAQAVMKSLEANVDAQLRVG
jgi:phenylalanyl-tRNA synthetase beta chain